MHAVFLIAKVSVCPSVQGRLSPPEAMEQVPLTAVGSGARPSRELCAEFKAGIPGNLLDSGGNYGEFIGVLFFVQFLMLIMTFLVF